MKLCSISIIGLIISCGTFYATEKPQETTAVKLNQKNDDQIKLLHLIRKVIANNETTERLAVALTDYFSGEISREEIDYFTNIFKLIGNNQNLDGLFWRMSFFVKRSDGQIYQMMFRPMLIKWVVH